jgi:hypothetical protein
MDTQSTITVETGTLKIGKKVSLNIQKDQNFNDLDRLYDLLLHEKHLLQVYQIGLHEAFNQDLMQLIQDNQGRVQEQHSRITQVLFDMGEYTADAAPGPIARDVAAVFMGYLKQLPYDTRMPH